MNIKFWISTMISIFLAIASVQAFADSGWYYDEDSDTIVFSYSGSPAAHPASHYEEKTVEHAGPWYFDEDSDTVVFRFTGNPASQTASHSDDENVAPAGPWYYDEDSDSIVFNIEESRSKSFAYVQGR